MKIKLYELKKLIRKLLIESSGISEPEALDLVEEFGDQIKNTLGIDYKTLKSVGFGTRGVAFDAGNNLILKITKDEREAMMSSGMIGNHNENLTQYYDVVQFGNTGVYGILQEKLEPLSNSEISIINEALVETRFPLFLVKAKYDFDETKKLVKEYMKQKYQSMPIEKGRAWLERANELWKIISIDYKIRGLATALKDLGILFHDYHGGNFMKRGNTLVLIDLGNSKGLGTGSGSIKTLKADNKSESRNRLLKLGESRIRIL